MCPADKHAASGIAVVKLQPFSAGLPLGPDLISYSDVAQELSAALGRSIEYLQTTPAEHRTAMIQAGIPEAVATSNAQAFGLIAEGDAAWLSPDVVTITDTSPRDLHTFVHDYLPAFT